MVCTCVCEDDSWIMSGSVSWIQNHSLPPHEKEWSSANLKGFCFSTSCFLSSCKGWIQAIHVAACYTAQAICKRFLHGAKPPQPVMLKKKKKKHDLNPKPTTLVMCQICSSIWAEVKKEKEFAKTKGNLFLSKTFLLLALKYPPLSCVSWLIETQMMEQRVV